jgi:DNA topoisomerase-6 subunit B
VGKEYIADRPEIEREILCGLREVARRLSAFISRRRSVEMERRRLNIFLKYLPKLASFSTSLAGKKEEPDINPLLRKVSRLAVVDEG